MATAFTDQDDFYKMDASPKGICLIINNFEFDRSPRLDTGPADKENLTRTFKNMDFEVRYFENQTCAQMKTRMESIQKEDHSNYDCFVCCISSHGNKTGVCGADDHTVNISELQEYVFSTQCPSLAGKPKVFFVDACRGGEGQKGHCLARSGAPTRPVVITDKRDFLVSFATTPDNVSYCNPDSTKGAVYFYHLTRLLEHYANSKTIMHILHKLNEALTVESTAHELQTAQYESTLAKELRFYCPVQAMVRALQQELTQARSRVQVLEREVKRKDDQIKQNDSANQLQEEKARHQNTAKQLKDCKKTCSALEKSCKERRHITRTQPNS
ncbi:caspase-3-like [Littorina saxatilis]|uniref:caspase-3-like n=1 Tax=Littorina saxatilis TaxID=31220 RepID=UPI0038B651D6